MFSMFTRRYGGAERGFPAVDGGERERVARAPPPKPSSRRFARSPIPRPRRRAKTKPKLSFAALMANDEPESLEDSD